MNLRINLHTQAISPCSSPKILDEVSSHILIQDGSSTQLHSRMASPTFTNRNFNTSRTTFDTSFVKIRRVNDRLKHKMNNDRLKCAQIKTSSNGISYPLDSPKSARKAGTQTEELLQTIGYLHSKNPRKLPTDIKSLREIAKRQQEIPSSSLSKQELSLITEKIELGLPAGRRDAQVLGGWLDSMLDKLLNSGGSDLKKLYESAKLVYSVCFSEIVRQVSVHCVERGQLMDKVWLGYIGLLERALNQKEIKQNKLITKSNQEKENITSYYTKSIKKLRTEITELQDQVQLLTHKLKTQDEVLQQNEGIENKLTDRLKLIQKVYKSTKKKLLIYKEDNRILNSQIENLGRIEIIQQPVIKKLKLKSSEDFDKMMMSDPLLGEKATSLNTDLVDLVELLNENGMNYVEKMIYQKFQEPDFVDKEVSMDLVEMVESCVGTELEFTCGSVGWEMKEVEGMKTERTEEELRDMILTAQNSISEVEFELRSMTQDIPMILAQYEDQLREIFADNSLNSPANADVNELKTKLLNKIAYDMKDKIGSIVSYSSTQYSQILSSLFTTVKLKLPQLGNLDTSRTDEFQSTTLKRSKLLSTIVSKSSKRVNPIDLLTHKIKSMPIEKLNSIMMKKILLKLITSIYNERIEFTKSNPNIQNTEFGNFVWDQLMKRYGILAVVKKKFNLILSTCMKYACISRINLFGRLLKLYDGLDQEDMNICIKCIEFVNNWPLGKSIPSSDYSEIVYVSYTKLQEAFKMYIQPIISPQEYARLLDKINILKTPEMGAVSIDIALQCAMNIMRKKKDTDTHFIRDIYNSADLNHDGFLEYRELELILRHISNIPYEYSQSLTIFQSYAENFCTEDDSYVQAVSFDNFCAMTKEFKLFSQERLEEFSGVREYEQVIKKLEELAPNIEESIANIKSMFSRNKEWWGYLDDLEEMLSNLKNSVINTESPLVVWLAYRLMEEESKRVALEDTKQLEEENSASGDTARSEEGLSIVMKFMGLKKEEI